MYLHLLGGSSAHHTVDQYAVLFRHYSLDADSAVSMPPSFTVCSRDGVITTDFEAKISENVTPHLHSLHWHTETDWNIATSIGTLTVAKNHLHCQAVVSCAIAACNFIVFIVFNVLFKVLILLTLDFNYIITCLMWATVSALLCLAVRFYCYFIHVYFLLVL